MCQDTSLNWERGETKTKMESSSMSIFLGQDTKWPLSRGRQSLGLQALLFRPDHRQTALSSRGRRLERAKMSSGRAPHATPAYVRVRAHCHFCSHTKAMARSEKPHSCHSFTSTFHNNNEKRKLRMNTTACAPNFVFLLLSAKIVALLVSRRSLVYIASSQSHARQAKFINQCSSF